MSFGITHLVGHGHPTLWVLIRKIKLEVGADRGGGDKDCKLSSTEQNMERSKTIQKIIRLQTLCKRTKNSILGVFNNKLETILGHGQGHRLIYFLFNRVK